MRTREEQINEMVAAFLRWAGPYKEKETESARSAFSKLASEWMQEAERRAEQCGQAEIGRLNEELSGFRAGLAELVAKEVAALTGPVTKHEE